VNSRKAGIAAELYKAVYQDYADDPLPSRSEQGRFHDVSTARSTTYLTAAAETAWREVRYRWKANPAAYRIARVQVRLSKIADLTDSETRTAYGTEEEALKGSDYAGRRCRGGPVKVSGVQGGPKTPVRRQLFR